jgi:cytochrome P450
MSVVVIAIVAVVVVGAVAVYLKDEKMNEEMRQVGIPGPPSWLPLIGNTLTFFMGPSEFPRNCHAEYGDVFTTKLFGTPTIHVSGKALMKQVLVTDQKKLHVDWPRSIRQLLGANSVMAAPEENRASMRRAIQSSLTPQQLRNFAPDMARILDTAVNSWYVC